jgi:geranylgeranyl diphosphate synthase type 3
VKSFALRLMERTGSFDYTVEYLRRVEKQARDVIASLGGNDLLTTIVDSLSTVYAKSEA